MGNLDHYTQLVREMNAKEEAAKEKPKRKEPTITDYESFKMCLDKDQEQHLYIPECRDSSYLEALGTFHRDCPDKYQEYTERLRKEYLKAFDKG